MNKRRKGRIIDDEIKGTLTDLKIVNHGEGHSTVDQENSQFGSAVPGLKCLLKLDLVDAAVPHLG